jgi:hypothetical protein
MFGKEPQQPEKTDLQNMMFANKSSLQDDRQQKTVLQQEEESKKIEESQQPEVVNIVEKISKIASPYFIAIVGLSLYQNNFFIGTILILIGIFSLLKISSQDIAKFLTWFKSFLGFN